MSRGEHEPREYDNITSNPKVFTEDEEDAIDGLVGGADEADEAGDEQLGDQLYNDAREVTDAALLRGGATWETGKRNIEFDDGSTNVAAYPSLRPTEEQIEAIREEMETSLANQEEGGEEEPDDAREEMAPVVSAPSHDMKGLGYVPTWGERLRGLFGGK